MTLVPINRGIHNVKELIEALQHLVQHGLSETAAVKAFDADAGEYLPITGFEYSRDCIEFQTEDVE